MKSDISQEVLKKWGVYKITNLINGNFYIGSTIESFEKRIFSKHISSYFIEKNKGNGYSNLLYKAFEKYGIENFKVDVLYYFNRKKDSITNKKIVTFIEGKLIRRLNPRYNICKFPEIGGCPNLGKKLDENWRKKISEKSKLYKHSNNINIYKKKSNQNKELCSLYKITKDDFSFIGSAKECSKIEGCSNIFRWIKKQAFSRNGFYIEKLKSQKRSIKLILENESIILKSFSECDKFLNIWRGFTSTQVVNKKDRILNYKYELL